MVIMDKFLAKRWYHDSDWLCEIVKYDSDEMNLKVTNKRETRFVDAMLATNDSAKNVKMENCIWKVDRILANVN